MAKQMLLNMIDYMISKTKREANNILHERPPNSKFVFMHQTYSEWEQLNLKVMGRPSTSTEWQNFLVTNIDYISNPTIIKKNSQCLITLIDKYLPKIDTPTVLNSIQQKISELKKFCYEVPMCKPDKNTREDFKDQYQMFNKF